MSATSTTYYDRYAKAGPGRLEWRDSNLPRSTTLYGYIASQRIASVGWRGGTNESRKYVVNTTLPGFTNNRRVQDFDTGKLLAERLLESFVKMVGGEFP